MTEEQREQIEEIAQELAEDIEEAGNTADDLFSKIEDLANELEGVKELAQTLVETLREAGIILPAETLHKIEGKK